MKLFGKTIDKKWFENYWYYYKSHTIVGFFVLLIVVYSAVECANRVTPDVSVTYIGSHFLNEDFVTNFEQQLSEGIEDINNDGIKNIQFLLIHISGEVKSEQDFAMQQKAQLEMTVGESTLFILDENHFNLFNEQGLFLDIAPFVGQEGPIYGLNASDSQILSDLGIQSDDDIYVVLRVLNQGDEKKEERVANHDNAKRILTQLFSNTNSH
ncbi:MAG: hypothetical protein GX800_03080 [Clostridiaceae bacterium]|nr:hypothetical protein [Clostridiaceae bacterium]